MSRHAGPILIDFDIAPVVLRIPSRQNTAFVNGRRASRADLAAAALDRRAGERNRAKRGDSPLRIRAFSWRRTLLSRWTSSSLRDDVNALPLRTRLAACARIHGCHGDVLNGRQKVPARQLAPSPCDHAQEDAIPPHEVMIERRADMSSHKAGNGDADEAMDEEKLLGECAALAPDRRQLE
jgi:hypothetical protein